MNTAPAALIGALQATAMPAGGPVPNYDYGYGIIRPVAAGRASALFREPPLPRSLMRGKFGQA